MDLTIPATSTPPAAVTGPLPAAAAAACHQLPFPRLAVVARSPPPLSPPPPPAATAPPSSGAPTLTAVAPPPGAGADATEEDRMDLLWEDFNEELARGGSCCRAAAAGPWPPSDSSDAESEPAAARGCAPVLRPSSRAGAVRHCRRRAGTWALLMRIFRRLFVVEKTVSRRHHAAATARAR